MANKLELLRVFDPKLASQGEAVCTATGMPVRYVGSSDSPDQAICEYGSRIVGYFDKVHLRMAPLCWVDGRPVYTGDTLFRNSCHRMPAAKELVKVTAAYAEVDMDGDVYLHYEEGGNSWVSGPEHDGKLDIMWEIPKSDVISISERSDVRVGYIVISEDMILTEEQADLVANATGCRKFRVEY